MILLLAVVTTTMAGMPRVAKRYDHNLDYDYYSNDDYGSSGSSNGGEAIAKRDDRYLNNVALGKETSQSSTGWGGVSDRAVDGKTDSNWNSNTCTHTEDVTSGWWKVNLLQQHRIKKIVIHNRADCCSDRIDGAKVYAGDVLCGTISYIAGQVEYPVKCDTIASSVKVDKPSGVLTLCEVEVFAFGKPVKSCTWSGLGEDKMFEEGRIGSSAFNFYVAKTNCEADDNCEGINCVDEARMTCWLHGYDSYSARRNYSNRSYRKDQCE